MSRAGKKRTGLPHVTRRQVVQGLIAASVAGAACAPLRRPRLSAGQFMHGVASGDPAPDSLIIWSRVTPPEPSVVDVRWLVAEDAEFRNVIQSGTSITSEELDYTVKALVENLEPGKTYYYRFKVGDVESPPGRTRTLPHDGVDRVRLAVVSCSHYSFGFYNVYREIAQNDELDAVVHLGDYIYQSSADESGSGYGAETGRQLGRLHDPVHEAVTLDDYRRRYAQYRSDPDLQAAHAAHAFISVWDDHETANDAWSGGADDHDTEIQGDWRDRRDAGLQAYYEWLPLREPGYGLQRYQIDRNYRFGRVASIHVVDVRYSGRSKQFKYSSDMLWQEKDFEMPDGSMVRHRIPFDVSGPSPVPETDHDTILRFERDGLPEGYEYWPDTQRIRDEILADPQRRMISEEQLAGLEKSVTESVQSDVAWQVLASSVIMARMDAPDFSRKMPYELIRDALENNEWVEPWLQRSRYGLPINVDAWDGYQADRQRVYDLMRASKAGFITISGDSHNSWMNQLHDDRDDTVLGVEFATTSVTSKGGYDWLGSDPCIFEIAEKEMIEGCRDVHWSDTRHRGFLILDLGRTDARAEYIGVDTVFSRDYTAKTLAEFTVDRAPAPRVRKPGN